MGFIDMPYLPKGRVSVAVGDVSIENVKIIKPYYVPCLPESMRLHADLSFCYLGGGVAVCAPEAYDYYSKELAPYGIELKMGKCAVRGNYPCDAAYNVAIVGSTIYCKKNITDPVLIHKAQEMGYKTVNINQGYAKCSVCPVDSNSAISADMSFYKAAVREGVDVLLITNDNIKLPGYPCGFFGGAAYMEAKGIFSVKGDITALPQYALIKEFLKKRNIKIKNSVGDVHDFGSLIPIIEE